MSSSKYHDMKKYGEWRNNSTAILVPVASSLELYISHESSSQNHSTGSCVDFTACLDALQKML
jgi:hypothetical protein